MKAPDSFQRTPVPAEASLRLSPRRHLLLSLLWFALNFQSAALLPIVIPVQIVLLVAPGAVGSAQQAAFLSALSAATGVVALIFTPLVGALSDHTAGSYGRRRPYIALGAAALIAGAVLLARPAGAGGLVVGLLLLTLGGTIATAGYQGLMPDLVPMEQHGEASGYIGVMTILGNAGSLILAGVLLGQASPSAADADAFEWGAAVFYVVTGIVLAAGTLLTLASVHETPLEAESTPDGARPSMRARIAAAWIAPWRNHNFRWVFLTRGSVMLGLDLFLTFIAYYFASVEHVANFATVTAALAVLALVGAAASAFGIGLLSDRIGRVSLVCFASACMAAAALVFVAQPGAIPLWPLGLLFGLGFGAYSSVDWALAVDVLPSPRSAGKDMGLWSMASNLPAIVAPLLGGGVIAVAAALGVTAAGYRAVFALAAIFMLAGAAFILLVRETVGARRPPPARRRWRRIALGWRLAPTHGGRPRGFLRFWPVYERFWRLFHRVQPIPDAPHDLLRVQFSRYHGRPITLPDGTTVRRGDRVGKLHLNNPVVSRVAAEGSALRLLPMLAGDLAALARWLASDAAPGGGELRAIHGVTLLARGAARLGFTLRERPRALYTRLDGFFMTGLLALYNPAGLDRLRRGTTYGREPVEIWMSRAELARRYGQRQPSKDQASD